jgi:outer membrane protein TolC
MVAHTQGSSPTSPWDRGIRFAIALATTVIATFAAAQAQAPQGSTGISLADALREIAARSTVAVSAGFDLDAARENTRRTQAPYYPSVSLSLGHFNRDDPIVAIFGTFAVPTTEKSFFTGQLDVTELLWDGGRRSSAVKGSRSVEDATAMRGQTDVRDAQLEGMSTYLGIMVVKAQRRVVAQREASLRDHLREVTDLFEEGVVARNDLLATEVRLRSVQDQASRVDNDEAVGLQALNRLMGRQPTDPLALPDQLPSPPGLPASLEELTKRATEGNQQLLALRARLRAEEDAVGMRKADYYPTLIAQASHTYQQNQYLLYPNANFLFLGVNWEAYDGGARKASVHEAEIAVARTAQEIADLQRQLAIRVDRAYRDYQQALREAGTAETNVQASEENLRIVEDQYKSGLARSTDVLDAESTLAESRFTLVNQHYNAYLKQGALLTVAGEDLPTFYATLVSKKQEP